MSAAWEDAGKRKKASTRAHELTVITANSPLDATVWRCTCGELFIDPVAAGRHTNVETATG